MQRERWGDAQQNWMRSGFPLTLGIMGIQFVLLFVALFAPSFVSALMLIVPDGFSQPWRLFTYPLFVGTHILNWLFLAGVLYMLGGSLERAWGTRIFAIFFFAMVALSGISLGLGAWLFKISVPCPYYLPIAALAVAWGIVNLNETIYLYFFPIRGMWVSALAALVVFFNFAQSNLGLTPFALLSCAASYLWVRHRAWSPDGFYAFMPLRERKPKLRLVPQKPRSQRPPDDRFTLRDLNPVEWFAKRQRRKKFERLMKDD